MMKAATTKIKAMVSSPGARRLLASVFILTAALAAFLELSAAWFSSSNRVKAENMGLSFIGVGAFELYEWDFANSVWVDVDAIDFSNGVPNETRRYKVLAPSISAVSFSFTNVTANTIEDTQPNFLSFIYVARRDSSADAVYGKNNFPAIAPVSTSVYSVSAVNPTAEFIFDIYIDWKVCNHFTEWGFSGRVNIG